MLIFFVVSVFKDGLFVDILVVFWISLFDGCKQNIICNYFFFDLQSQAVSWHDFETCSTELISKKCG